MPLHESVEVWEPAMLGRENLQLRPVDGDMLVDRLTVPEKPL